eukprot:GFYU01008124.1.p1 GENE.GFYU01008124.1~~GFYU01008124.1.p1  ORF type:complete len:654 (-),score=203.06 GFYU01008124.1:142-2103(-)
MVLYNFKKIQVVPPGNEFIDIILSKTQRQTPTVIHPGYKISRIRSFYMRKVKFTQQNYNERLGQIILDFPRLDDIHPFYGDLINVLYDRDHYKLALGHINTARTLIDTVGKDYVRLIKYGESLYRCKQLKRAALGRMCTIAKKLSASLSYLEQVRQHLARLPSIDPNTRTLLVCGYPNVGKSSFMNTVTRANVEVQPYAFTTKSLFVGHMDYQYIPWQVIDTPGILDHPLEDRNTIEMQSITALAHLRAAILYFIDISERCGYTIEQQVSLFDSIKPLFQNKPLIVVMNKIDVLRPEQLSDDRKELLAKLEKSGITMLPMSSMSQEGVNDVKTNACNKLLEARVQTKLRSSKATDILNKLHVAQPNARDTVKRSTFIPDSVSRNKDAAMAGTELPKRRTERDIEAEEGGPGVYSINWKKNYKLENPDWNDDIIPEIMDGKNIADYFTADIEAKLDALEAEEVERVEMKQAADDAMEEQDDSLDEDEKERLDYIRQRKAEIIVEHRMNRGNNRTTIVGKGKALQSTVKDLKAELDRKGVEADKAVERTRGRSRSRPRPSKSEGDDMEMADAGEERGRKRARSQSRPKRDASQSRDPMSGFRNVKQKTHAVALEKKNQWVRNKDARKGEGDRVILQSRPKHLFTGKRGIGKTDRR